MYWSMVRWSTESEQPYARDSSTLEMWNTSMKWNISHIFKNDLVHKGERVSWVGLSPRLIWKPVTIPDHLLLACLGTLVWAVVEDVKSGEKRWLNNLNVVTYHIRILSDQGTQSSTKTNVFNTLTTPFRFCRQLRPLCCNLVKFNHHGIFSNFRYYDWGLIISDI